MNIKLIGYSQPNMTIYPATDISDLAALGKGRSTFTDNLIEYAGRLCYRSTARMGTAPHFVRARIKEGHEDIIEHVWVSFYVDDTHYNLYEWYAKNRYISISPSGYYSWIVSGNLRVWLDLCRIGVGQPFLPWLIGIAPEVFCDFWNIEPVEIENSDSRRELYIPSIEDGPMRVTLLAAHNPIVAPTGIYEQHGAATFLFEGVSRALTHQLVRHRLGSFSQESQRYVDLAKGGWRAIVPPAIEAQEEAKGIMDDFWQQAESSYASLRGMNIRKEDARFLLPNAAETRIVVTMSFAGWSHFCWLRALDKAAQWEIRRLGQHTLRMLYEVERPTFISLYKELELQLTSAGS